MEGGFAPQSKAPNKKSFTERFSLGKIKKAGMALLSMALFNHAIQAQGKIPTEKAKPTTQDSLNLYNNTNELLDYYSVKNKYVDMGTRQIDPTLYNISKENSFAVDYMDDKLKNKIYPWTNRRYESIGNNAWQLLKAFTFGKVQTDHLDADDAFKLSDYYKKINENQYKQRELENIKIDMEAPMQLYDNRINPTISYRFQNRNDKYDGIRGTNPMYGDISTFYGYDPIVIKPAAMKTKEDWQYLNKKYGTPIPGQKEIKTTNPIVTEKKVDESNTVKQNPVQLLKTEVPQKKLQEPVSKVTKETEDPQKKNLSQYNKIVNGKKVPITKEEYDSLLKAGHIISQETTGTYDKNKYQVVPKINK